MSSKRIANIKTFNFFCSFNQLDPQLTKALMANQSNETRKHLWFLVEKSITSMNPDIRRLTKKYALNLIKEVSSQ